MDPTEELDLGADDYTKKDDAKKDPLAGGLAGSIKNKPFQPLDYQHRIFIDKDGDGEQDPDPLDMGRNYDPSQFEDYQKLNGELSALSSDATGLGRLRKSRSEALDGFMESHMAPFYKETLGEGLLDAEKSDFEDSEKLFQRFDSHFQNPETQAQLPKYKQIKEKYGRLKADFDRYNDAEQNALARKDTLTKAKYSFPETFRRAADNYKAETQKPISEKALNEVLDAMEFEEPIHGLKGLLNEHKLDPRIPYDTGTGLEGKLGKGVNQRKQQKLGVLKNFKKIQEIQARDEGLRSQGVDFSENGKFGGFPLYLNNEERGILSLEKAQQAGAKTWKGQPIEQAFEDLGGQDKLIASKMVETVFHAHNVAQDAAINYWRDQTPENKEKFELTKRVREEAWAQAARMGLGNEIPGRGDTVGFFAALGNAFRRGDLQEDLSDFSPALLGAIDLDTAQQVIDIMEQTEDLKMSSAYKQIKATKSKGFFEALGKIFSNGSAIPEMIAETLTAFFSAWGTEAARVVPVFAGIGAGKGALVGSGVGPKGTLAGAGAGAMAGAGWGLKASAGIASFVLEYAGEVLNEMSEMGIDWKNPHIFVAAWNNPKIREKIRAKAAKYAGGIAMIDLVAAGTVGKVKKAVATKTPSNLIRSRTGAIGAGNITRKSNIAGNIAETGYQSGLGMLGEVTGQIWSRDPGDPLIRDYDAIAAEGLIEWAGPSGAGVLANMVTDKIGSHQMSVEGAEERIINRVEGSSQSATVEQVDKDGMKFTRQYFPTAAVAVQELSKLGVDFSSAEGKVLNMLMMLMGGRLKNVGFVITDRSPTAQNMKGTFDQMTGTVYVNSNLSKSHALTILHETGHFVEQAFNINVRDLYNTLTPEEKEEHWASYVKGGEAKFSDLNFWQKAQYNGVPVWKAFGERNGARAASEWFSHQMVRVLTGADQNINPKVKKSVNDFAKLFENSEEALMFLGASSGEQARSMLAATLMEAFGVDQNGAPSTIDAFGELILKDDPANSSLFPSINFGQDVSAWTKNEKDILAYFLGYYKGWDSISRSDQNSIAAYFAGSNLLNTNIQETNTEFGDPRPRPGDSGQGLVARRGQTSKAPRQTVPGQDPRFGSRRGRGARQGMLGSDNVTRVTGSDKGRSEEYQQTLNSLDMDREQYEDEFDALVRMYDEAAEEEAELELRDEIEKSNREIANERSYDETAQEEAELELQAEREQANREKQIENEYDEAYEEYGINTATQISPLDENFQEYEQWLKEKYNKKDGMLGSNNRDKTAEFYQNLMLNAKSIDSKKPFNVHDPDAELTQKDVYETHFWKWKDSLDRKGIDNNKILNWANKFNPQKYFGSVYGKQVAPLDAAFQEYIRLRGPEQAPDRQDELVMLGSELQPLTKNIPAFRGNLSFLSNFTYLKSPIKDEFGIFYNSVENAFQASKTNDKKLRYQISKVAPSVAKRQGQKMYTTKAWRDKRVETMRSLVRAKFNNNPDLKRQLKATAGKKIEELNSWKDTFWGVYEGKGENHLGRILQEVRDGVKTDRQDELVMLGSKKIDGWVSKIQKHLTESITQPQSARSSNLKTEIERIIKSDEFPGDLRDNPLKVFRKLLGIDRLADPNKPFFVEASRAQPAWYKTKLDISKEEEQELIRKMHQEGKVDSKLLDATWAMTKGPISSGSINLNDVDHAVSEYMEIEDFRKLAAQAPLVENVLEPYGVHLIANTNELSETEVITDKKIGEIGQLVNFRKQRMVDGKPVVKDMQNGEPISMGGNAYAYRIIDLDISFDEGKPFYYYGLQPVTKEQATVSMPWYEVPISRLAMAENSEAGNTRYGLTPEQRETWGDTLVYGKSVDGYSTILRQYTTIGDALRGKSWKQVGKRLQLPSAGKHLISVGEVTPDYISTVPIQELAKLAGAGINSNGKIVNFGQGPLFRLFNTKLVKGQIDFEQSRMILNLVFATLNHQQEITNSDLKKANTKFQSELDSSRDTPTHTPLNWQNTSLLRPDYAPMNMLAALFARVLDIMGDRKKNIPVQAETLADYQLLELMGVREWVENLPILAYYLPAESRNVGTGAVFTALRRFIVTANQDFLAMGEDSDGNILSTLVKNTPDETLYPDAADGAARLETIKMPLTNRTPQKAFETSTMNLMGEETDIAEQISKSSDVFTHKNANEELDYVYGWYIDENGQAYWDIVEYNAPRYETTKDGITIDNGPGRGTGIWEIYDSVGEIFKNRRGKKSVIKSERQQNEYLADQIKIQAAAQRVNPDTIGTLSHEDLYGEKSFPSSLRREAEHSPNLRSKNKNDYVPGKPAVILKQFTHTVDKNGEVTVPGTKKVAQAEAQGKGVSVMRRDGMKHYGNPFTYLPNVKGAIRVSSRKKAIEAFRQWLRQPFEGKGSKVIDQDILESQAAAQVNVSSVEPERRKWILDQIKSGKLDGKTLLYSAGYAGNTANNHAIVLQEFVNEIRPKQKAEQWKIDWATGKDKEKGYYNWVLKIKSDNAHAMIMGKRTSIPLTQAQKDTIINTKTLLGEAGRDELHDKAVLNSEEETPLSVANKVEKNGLVTVSTAASKNALQRETEGGIANGLVHAIKWADYILLSYFQADPGIKNPQAVLRNLTRTLGGVYDSNQITLAYANKGRAKSTKKKKPLTSEYPKGIPWSKESYINDAKLLLIRKLVADSHGLTEKFGERVENPVSEDTSIESQVDSFNPEGEDTADIEAGSKDKSKAVRLEQRGDSGQVDTSAIAPDEALMQKEDASQKLFKSVAFNDNDLAALNSLRSELVEEQGEPGTTEKEAFSELSDFIQKQLLKSVRDGTDNTVVQDLARALVRAKKINTIEQAENEINRQLDKLQKNNFKEVMKFKEKTPDRPPKTNFDPKRPFDPPSKDSKKKQLRWDEFKKKSNLRSVKFGKQSYNTEASPVQSNINLPKQSLEPTIENAEKLRDSEASPKKGTQPQFSAEEGLASAKQKKEYIVPVPPIKIASKLNDALNGGMLGSAMLTSSFATPLYEQLRWMAMGSYDKLPESVQDLVYAARVNIFSQFISAEDLHQRLIMNLGLPQGKRTRDFFDLQGHIIRNFSSVKAASDFWRTDLRDPILEYLIDYKVTPEEFGALAIAISTGNQNRYLEKKLKAAVELQMERLYGELTWDSKTRTQVRAGKGIIDNIASAKTAVKNAKAQNVAQKNIDKAQERLDRLQAEKRSAEHKIKQIDIDSYRVGSEFAGAGMTSNEAMDTYDKLTSDPRIEKLLKETDIMEKFTKLNLQTIVMLGTSGMIDAGQVYRMYVSHYRIPKNTSAQAAHKKVIKDLENLGLDFKNTDITTDYNKLDPKIKQDWQNQYTASKNEISQGMPEGYFYASMSGFADVEGFFQTQEELAAIFGESPKSGGKGAGRGIEPARTNRLFQYSMGRKVNVAPPDPNAVLAMSFASAENALIRVSKKPSSDHVISLYRFYSDLYKHRKDFSKLSQTYAKDGVMPNSKPLIDSWDLGVLLKDKNAAEMLFKELDEIFEYMDFDAVKKHPIEESVKLKEVAGQDGAKRLVLQHVVERVDDNDPHLFIGRFEGERVYARFKANKSGKRFSAELKNMGYAPVYSLLSMKYFSINAITKFLSMTYTSWNPDFILTNAIRDAINAQANMSEQQSEKFKKSFKKSYIKKIFRANKGIWRSEKKMNVVEKRKLMQSLQIPLDLKGMINKYGFEDLSAQDWQAWWLFLEINGLRTSFIKLDTLNDALQNIEKEFKDGTTGNMWKKMNRKSPVDLIKKIGENYVDPLNTTVENATRLVTAVEALKAGMTVHQAVMLGRNVSVDFNRKGQMSANIGAIFVFFNAGVQGNLRFFRSLVMRGPKDAMKVVGSIAGTSFLWAWLQMLISGDDEEDENFSHYDELGDVQKDGNIVGFVPGSKTHFNIPLPYGWNFIWGMGQKLAQVSARQLEVGGQGLGAFEAMGKMTDNFTKQFSPIGGMPTILTPYLEIEKNENFFGSPIEKVKFPFDPPKPQAYMNRESTAKFWKDFAITLNSIGGGDEVTPGSLKRMFGDNSLYNSPENDVEWALSGSALEHYYNAFTGGVGSTFSRVVSGAYGATKGDFDINLSQVPVFRRFVRNDYSSYKTLQRFFGLRDRVNMVDRYVKMAKKGAMPPKEAQKAIRLNKDLINIKGLVDAADTSRKALKRKGDAIMKSKLSESEKRSKMEEIEKQTLAAYRKVLIKASKLGIEV